VRLEGRPDAYGVTPNAAGQKRKHVDACENLGEGQREGVFSRPGGKQNEENDVRQGTREYDNCLDDRRRWG